MRRIVLSLAVALAPAALTAQQPVPRTPSTPQDTVRRDTTRAPGRRVPGDTTRRDTTRTPSDTTRPRPPR